MEFIEIPNILEYIEGNEIRLDKYIHDISTITQLKGEDLKAFLYNYIGLNLFDK